MGKSIVWILGAGFSRSLGGPLLVDLFSERTRHEIQAVYPALKEFPAPVVWDLFWQGFTGNNGRRLWWHAEDFLDYLDTACEKPGSNNADILRLERMLQHTCDRTRNVTGYRERKPSGSHRADIEVWPLYAEDFLSVVLRDAL